MFLEKDLDENFKLFIIFIRHAWWMAMFSHQNAWSRIMVLMVCCAGHAGHLAINVIKFATACIQCLHREAWIASLSSRYVNTKCVRHRGQGEWSAHCSYEPCHNGHTRYRAALLLSPNTGWGCQVMGLWDECLFAQYLATSLVWSWILRQLNSLVSGNRSLKICWHV